jgi:hypothetical protein
MFISTRHFSLSWARLRQSRLSHYSILFLGDPLYINLSAHKRGASRYELRGLGNPEGGPIPIMSYKFCVTQYHNYYPIVQINPRRARPSHSATESRSSRFSIKIFSRVALAGVGNEGNKIYFTGSRNSSLRPLLLFHLISLQNGPLSYVYAPENCVYLSSNP